MQSVNTTTYLLLPKSQEKGYIEKVYFWTKKDMSLHPLHTCILTLLLGVVKAPLRLRKNDIFSSLFER